LAQQGIGIFNQSTIFSKDRIFRLFMYSSNTSTVRVYILFDRLQNGCFNSTQETVPKTQSIFWEPKMREQVSQLGKKIRKLPNGEEIVEVQR